MVPSPLPSPSPLNIGGHLTTHIKKFWILQSTQQQLNLSEHKLNAVPVTTSLLLDQSASKCSFMSNRAPSQVHESNMVGTSSGPSSFISKTPNVMVMKKRDGCHTLMKMQKTVDGLNMQVNQSSSSSSAAEQWSRGLVSQNVTTDMVGNHFAVLPSVNCGLNENEAGDGRSRDSVEGCKHGPKVRESHKLTNIHGRTKFPDQGACSPRNAEQSLRLDDERNDEPKVFDSCVSLRSCKLCGTTRTPLWRGGPQGPKSLCNACGIRMKKARRQFEASLPVGGTLGASTMRKTARPLKPSSKTFVLPVKRKAGEYRSNVAATKKGAPKQVRINGNTDTIGARKLQTQTSSDEEEGARSTNTTVSATPCFYDNSAGPHLAGGYGLEYNSRLHHSINDWLNNNNNDFAGKVARLLNESGARSSKDDEEEAAVLLMALSCGLVLG